MPPFDEPKDRDAAAAEIERQACELAAMARRHGHVALAYLLDMVVMTAREAGGKPVGTGRDDDR